VQPITNAKTSWLCWGSQQLFDFVSLACSLLPQQYSLSIELAPNLPSSKVFNFAASGACACLQALVSWLVLVFQYRLIGKKLIFVCRTNKLNICSNVGAKTNTLVLDKLTL